MPIVKFIYSRSRNHGGSVMQIHDQPHEILAPGNELILPALRDAERAFQEWFADTFPEDDLIRWKAVYADGGGLYSEYQAMLPTNYKKA
jgi:hypothetical protein